MINSPLIKRLSLFLVVMIAMTAVFIITCAPSLPRDDEGMSSFSILVEAGTGIGTAYFKECSGIGSENEVIGTRSSDATGKLVTNLVPGKYSTYTIDLTRLASDDMNFYNWRKTVEDGKINKRNITITLMDISGEPVAKWSLLSAWPCKIKYDMADGLFTETISISCDKLQRVPV